MLLVLLAAGGTTACLLYLTAGANVTKHAGSRDEDGVEERAETRTHRSPETKPLLPGLGWAPHRGTRGE